MVPITGVVRPHFDGRIWSQEDGSMRPLILCLAVFCLFLAIAYQASAKTQPSITKSVFGKLDDGREVFLYTLTNGNGVVVQIINYGATLVSLKVPDRNGKIADVVLGYDSLQAYVNGTSYFGATVGRYANRIAKGRFTLDGEQYQLTINNDENHLHGGKIGFSKVLWDVKSTSDSAEPSLKLQYVSRDGEEGYPGTVTLNVTYTLTRKNELRIDYEGSTDKPTILNPTHHSYFNLSGDFTTQTLSHTLMIEADSFTPIGKDLIPTGQIAPVAKTPLDFRKPVRIGEHISDPYEQSTLARGYDHNFVLRGGSGKVRKAAELYDPASGRLMTVYTDQPGLQFYTGNFLDGTAVGKNGIAYGYRTGLSLEAEDFPDSPNKPNFLSPILRPGQAYHQTTIYQFSTR
jgi:aldose 1-epimerase